MPTIALDTLPLDVLDLVFQLLEESFSGYGRHSRTKTFCRLCHVNRALLPLARQFLYAKPLVGCSTWKSATRLITTLQMNDNALGRLVRSLVELPDLVSVLTDKDAGGSDLPFKVEGQTQEYPWFLAMLNACPNLKQVGLVFQDVTQLAAVLDALSPSLRTLKKIKLSDSKRCYTDPYIAFQFFYELDMSEVQQLELHIYPPTFSDSDRLPFRVRDLTIDVRFQPLLEVSSFLPEDASNLRSLSLYDVDSTSSRDLVDLVHLIGPSLVSLSVQTYPEEVSERYAAYGKGDYGEAFPLELFPLLPNMRFLTLSGYHALSPVRLQALLDNSPKLVELGCQGSVWTTDTSTAILSPFEGWQAALFPEDAITTVFKQFQHLERVDLGLVPYNEPARPKILEKELKKQGIEVIYEACTDRCGCGAYHR